MNCILLIERIDIFLYRYTFFVLWGELHFGDPPLTKKFFFYFFLMLKNETRIKLEDYSKK